ncbi:MAG: hypothetical protein ACLVKO_06900 [Dysgonomonas sp.]
MIDAEKVSYNGKEVATTDMIPDTSKFISTNATSDEIITISTNKEMTLYNGVDKGFTLLQRGSDYPNSQQITMTKDNGVEIISNKKGINFSTNEGKFTYNKKEVATTDQIPDTSNFIKNSGNPGYNIGIDTTKEIFLTSESIYYSHPDSSNTTIFMFPIDPAADETGLSMIVNGDFELSTNNFKLNDKEVATTDMIPDTSNYVMKENKEDINISSSKSINISANESIAIFGDGGNMVLSSSSGASIQGTTKLDENGNLSLDLNDVNGTVVWGDMVMISSANSILLGVRNTDPNGDPISSIELSAEGIQINTDDTTNADGVYVRDQGKLKFMDKASFKTWLGI